MGVAALLTLEDEYHLHGGSPSRLAELAFRLVHSSPWLSVLLLFAACLFVLMYLLARRHGTWLVFLAPLACLVVFVPIIMAVWLPLRQIMKPSGL